MSSFSMQQFAQSNNFSGITHFTHVTLTTGHSCPQVAEDVLPAVIAHLAPVVAESLADGRAVPMAALGDGVTVQVSRQDGAFRVEVFRAHSSGRVLVLTFGVALDGATGRSLWQRLHRESQLPCRASAQPPSTPWIAARIEPGALTCPGLLWLLGDFECAIAWTLAHTFHRPAGEASPEGVWQQAVAGQPASCGPRHPIPSEDGVCFEFNRDYGPTLFVYFTEPTDAEIADVLRGECRFALVRRDCVLFLLAKFGNLPWLDAPYSVGLYEPQLRAAPNEWTEGKRLALAVRLIDRATGEQRGARMVTFSPEFSASLVKAVELQARAPFDRARYDAAIASTYRAYATSRSLLSAAQVKCLGGS